MASEDKGPERLVRSYQELLDLLRRDNVMHQPNLAAGEVLIPTQRGQLDSVLMMRWQTEESVLQFVQPLAFEIPAERMQAMAVALSRLNPALAISGFELSYERRRVVFRTTLPLMPRGGLLPGEIQMYFRITVKTAADFLPTLSRVAAGQASPDTIVADATRDLEAVERGAQKPPDVLGTY